MRLSCVVFLLALCSARTCVAEQVTLHGFIVGIPSPTAFEFDDFSVTRDSRLSLEINSNPAKSKNTLRPGEVRVGDEVEISGNFDAATHKLTIKTVKVLSVDDRRFNSAAFPDRPPELQRTAAGWNGNIFLDGARIRIADSTHVTFRRNKGELTELQKQQNGVVPVHTVSLAAPDEIGLNTMASYAAVGQKDGSVLASRIEFENFELSLDESKRLQRLAPRVQKGDPRIAQPDERNVVGHRRPGLGQSEAEGGQAFFRAGHGPTLSALVRTRKVGRTKNAAGLAPDRVRSRYCVTEF